MTNLAAFSSQLPSTFAQRLRDAERKATEQAAARSLEASSIGAGGLHIIDGGEVTVDGVALSGLAAASSFGNAPGGNGVTPTFQSLTSCAVDVPAGYTKAIVTAVGSAWALCDAPSFDYFYVQSFITISSTTDTGWTGTAGILAQSDTGTVPGAVDFPQGTAMCVRAFEGLDGGTISANVNVRSDTYTWSAAANSGGAIQVQVLFIA